MAVDRSYIGRNNASRKRLETLVARCTDGELAQTMPAGWTVASVLAHVAFWDHRIEVLFERWRSTGTAPAPRCSPAHCPFICLPYRHRPERVR